ncbi:sulfotransferase domain-containing protein [Colwellia sp. TT2012]|uniref:sulfotransferase domain-containing protein n=1 Tax=Colwellia sp. TT2012 TaxID=1720342 RepID=UPI00070B8496|nr:sulfotransferase domain-containing protein [Colwellia sp. TT2012]
MNQSIRSNLIKRVPFRLRKTLFKLKLYIKAPRLFFLSKKTFNTCPPPILLLSFPRSGSSWIGSIMGMGEDVRYLREPATTNYTLTESKKNNKTKDSFKIKRISVFDQESCDNWPEYQQYIDDSLSAKPNFTNAVIAYPKQWQSVKQKKALLIKEVNPLAINYYLSKDIKLIYLVRHPFSVAKSYQALNWRANDLFSKKFNPETLTAINNFSSNIQNESIWLQMGYLQGWVEAMVKEQITITNNSATIIRYEDVCQSPDEQFKALFDFADLNYSSNTIAAISKSLSRNSRVAAGDFTLTRKSSELAQIKVKAGEHANYFQLMDAYQQAFSNFKQNTKLDNRSTNNITTSYCKDSALVELC